MTDYIPFALLFLLGVVILIATFTGWARDGKGKIALIMGFGFMLLGLCLCVCFYFQNYITIYFLMTLPLGLWFLYLSFYCIKDCLGYHKRIEAIFLGANLSHHASNGSVYYSLLFRYTFNGKPMEENTTDSHLLSWIEKKYQPNETYSIWISPKDPDKIRIKRFEGLCSGIIALFMALGAFNFLFLLLKSLGTA